MSIDPDALPVKVRNLLDPIVSVSSPPKQGMYSQVVFAETELGSVAIKRAVGNRIEALQREYFVLNTLKGINLPVPEALLFVEPVQTEESWLVMRRLPGEPLEFILQSEEPVASRTQLFHNLGKTIAHLHSIPYPPSLVPQGSNWLDDMLEQAWDNLARGIGEGSKELFVELQKARPDPIEPVLIHGDLFPDNVLTNGVEITGLIDWAFGAVGDPRYDITLATYDLSIQDHKSFLEGYGKPVPVSQRDTDFFQKLALFF